MLLTLYWKFLNTRILSTRKVRYWWRLLNLLLRRLLLRYFWNYLRPNSLKVLHSIWADPLRGVLKHNLLKRFPQLCIDSDHTHFILRVNGLLLTLTHGLAVNQLSFRVSTHRSLIWALSFTLCKHICWLDSLHRTVCVRDHLRGCSLGFQGLNDRFVSSSRHSPVLWQVLVLLESLLKHFHDF